MDVPVKKEIVLREIPLSSSMRLSKKEMVRWLALSLGLVGPNDKRDGAVAVLSVLIDACPSGLPLSIEEIKRRASHMHNMSEKNVYYHIKKLKEVGIVSKLEKGYVLGDGVERDLATIIRSTYGKAVDSILNNVEEVAHSLQSM